MFLRIWEYEVSADRADAFIAAYGADGDWTALFRRSAGYTGTELYRDIDAEHRFLTVDRWTDEHGWRVFLDRFRTDYEALDARLDGLADGGRPLLEGPHDR